MKLVLDTLMIFFGTLAAAGLVALGEPADTTIVHPVGQLATSTSSPGSAR